MTGLNWKDHPQLVLGLLAAAVFALLGLVSLWWTPYPIEEIAIARRFAAPSAAHWLGTDHLGRDMLSLVMSGTLTSFVVAALGVLIGVGIGVPIGLAAVACGGRRRPPARDRPIVPQRRNPALRWPARRRAPPAQTPEC